MPPVGSARVLATGSKLPVPPRAVLPERCRNGLFYEPTVIEGLGPACRVEQEEIFGPVVTVQKFSTEEDALRQANGTGYGLAAIDTTRN